MHTEADIERGADGKPVSIRQHVLEQDAEILKLRETLRGVLALVGGQTAPEVSTDFLCQATEAAKAYIDEMRAAVAEVRAKGINEPCADAIELLWKDVILAHRPKYGPWEYPGQAYRHLRDEFNDLRRENARLTEALEKGRQTNRDWLKANGPGGWIDDLRNVADSLREKDKLQAQIIESVEESRDKLSYRVRALETEVEELREYIKRISDTIPGPGLLAVKVKKLKEKLAEAHTLMIDKTQEAQRYFSALLQISESAKAAILKQEQAAGAVIEYDREGILKVYGREFGSMQPPAGYEWLIEDGKIAFRIAKLGESMMTSYGMARPGHGDEDAPRLILKPKAVSAVQV